MLAAHQVDLVLDVGANQGQYGLDLRDCGYTGRIISFEPLRNAHTILSEVASRDPLWTVAERMAIGESNGTATINVSGTDASSSLLPMLGSHLEAAPASGYVDVESVELCTLDSAFARVTDRVEGGKCSRVFLKIDVQGYEAAVLAGARDLLQSRICGMQIEMSLVPLYEGQVLYADTYDQVSRSGFKLWNLFPVFSDANSGRLLQVDGVFFRAEPTKR